MPENTFHCSICGKPCDLETRKITFDGKPVHSDCLANKLAEQRERDFWQLLGQREHLRKIMSAEKPVPVCWMCGKPLPPTSTCWGKGLFDHREARGANGRILHRPCDWDLMRGKGSPVIESE
jgi:hypothetical protein